MALLTKKLFALHVDSYIFCIFLTQMLIIVLKTVRHDRLSTERRRWIGTNCIISWLAYTIWTEPSFFI
jgi:hypothetical protein